MTAWRPSARSLRFAEPVGAAIVALWLSRSFWLPGRFVVGLDTFAYSAPNYRVTIDEWRAGRVPLWNDLIFGGVTHAGNPQAGVFSPTKVIGFFFDTHRAMNLTVAAHLVLMAVTTVFLLRRLGVRPPAAFAGAVLMVANGAVLTRSIQFEQIIVLAWAPALLWAIAAVVGPGSRRWGAMAAAAATTAMVLLSGHPQTIYQVVVLAGAWTLALGLRHRDLRRLADLAVAVGLGLVASAIHLLAAVAATRDSAITAGRDLDELASPLLATRPEFLAQSLMGSVRNVSDAQFAGGFESVAHLGVVGGFLAVGALVLLFRTERVVAVVLGVTMVLAAIWSLGPRTPVFRIAYDWLPGFDLARSSARWLSVSTVAASIAVGLGLEALRRRVEARDVTDRRDVPLPARRARFDAARDRLGAQLHVVAPSVVFAAVLVTGAAGVVEVTGAAVVVPWLVTGAVVVAVVTLVVPRAPALGLVVLAALVTLEMGAIGRHSSAMVATTSTSIDDVVAGPATELAGRPGLTIALTDDAWHDTAYLVAGFRPNTNVLAGVASLDGYDGGVQVTERFATLIERLAPEPDVELPLRNNLPPTLGVELGAELGLRWALVDDRRDVDAFLPGWVRTELSDRTFTVWENPAWVGEATMTDVDGLVRPAPVERRSPGHLVVDASVDPALATDRTLVVHRQTAPGWTATVDGRRVDLAPGDGFFLTLDLPAGAVEVELRYQPRWRWPGTIASALGLTAIAALAGVHVLGRGRTRETNA